MRYTENMHEILQKINIAPEFEKHEVASKYVNNSSFKKLLSIIFDPRIEWDLPEGMPPHRRDETIPPDYAYSTLAMELKTLYIYLKPSPLHSNVRRESRFIELIESLHYTETDLLIAMKDGKYKKYYPGADLKLMMEIFPESFRFDGIFERGEWLAIHIKRNNGGNISDKVIFIKPEELDHIVTTDMTSFFVKNWYTGEVYKDRQKVESKTDQEPETVEKPEKKTRGRPKATK
jgi:hypothetical protein